MKRFSLIFTTVIWTAFVTLFLVKHAGDDDPRAGLEFERLEGEALPLLETPRGPHVLRGVVLSDFDQPTPDVLVELVAIEPVLQASPWSTRTNADGAFELTHLPAGRYVAHLICAGAPPIRYETTVPAKVRWRLPLPFDNPNPLPPLVVSPLAGSLAPPVGWTVEQHPLGGFEVVLVPAADSDPLTGAMTRRAPTDAGGAFLFEDLVHDVYDVFVLPPWAADGDWPRLAEESLRHASAEREHNLRLRSGSLDVRIFTPGASPVRSVLVQLWPREQPNQIWPLTTSNETGRCAIEHLPPATYRVRVHAGEHAVERDIEVRIGQRAQLVIADFGG